MTTSRVRPSRIFIIRNMQHVTRAQLTGNVSTVGGYALLAKSDSWGELSLYVRKRTSVKGIKIEKDRRRDAQRRRVRGALNGTIEDSSCIMMKS